MLIRDALLRRPVRTIAFVNKRAISAGALISLAATSIVMAEGGTLGAATPMAGRGYVVTTGVRTELGAIAESIRGGPEAETPLQHRMKRFAHVIGIAVFLSSSAAFAIGVSLGASPSPG